MRREPDSMSNFVKILVFLPFLLGMCSFSEHPYQKWCEQVFRADSGFVSSAREKELLLLICRHDTAVFQSPYREFLLETMSAPDSVVYDSSGKYYRGREIDGERQWVLCLVLNAVTAELPFVIEFTERNGIFSLNSWGRYYHGNYGCCWENRWEEFAKLGPYFYVETCGTGTGFCSGTANFLTFPLSPNDDNEDTHPSIPLLWFQSYLLQEALEGRLSIRGDTIVADYTYKVDTLIENAAEEMIPHPVYDTRFTALFRFDPEQRKLTLLNRGAVLREERLKYFFEDY